jgi:hypothetical protein
MVTGQDPQLSGRGDGSGRRSEQKTYINLTQGSQIKTSGLKPPTTTLLVPQSQKFLAPRDSYATQGTGQSQQTPGFNTLQGSGR